MIMLQLRDQAVPDYLPSSTPVPTWIHLHTAHQFSQYFCLGLVGVEVRAADHLAARQWVPTQGCQGSGLQSPAPPQECEN